MANPKIKLSLSNQSLRIAQKRFEGLIADEIDSRIEKAGVHLRDEIRKNASVTRYSQRQLDSKGNPYARKHGSIQYRRIPPLRSFQIHTRTGKFLRSIRGRLFPRTSKRPAQYTIFLQGAPEYAKFLIEGSKVMMPRDIFVGTYNLEKGTIRNILLGG